MTRPAVATALSLTEPLTAALLGVLLLGEPATGYTLAGAGLVCAGLLLTVGTVGPARPARPPRPGTAQLPHPG